MVVRLAFAVAINVDPEILLVDEALAVGDIYFRQRCMRKVHELRAARHHHSVRLSRRQRREGHRRPRPVAGPRPHGGYRRARPGDLQIPGRHDREGLHVPPAQIGQPGPRRAQAGRCRRRKSWRPSPISTTASAMAARRSSASRCSTSRAARPPLLEPSIAHRGAHQRARHGRRRHADRGLHAAQSARHGFLRHQHGARRLRTCAACRPGDITRWISTSICPNSTRRPSRFPRRSPTAR